jgi:hypothetical protein
VWLLQVFIYIADFSRFHGCKLLIKDVGFSSKTLMGFYSIYLKTVKLIGGGKFYIQNVEFLKFFTVRALTLSITIFCLMEFNKPVISKTTVKPDFLCVAIK